MKKIKSLFGLLIIGFGLLINHTFSNFEYNGVYYQDGFYYNEEKGLITFIIGDEVSTRQDKNLGAVSVYDGTISSFGTISCDNYGNFYQFGNNFGFPCDSVISGVYNNLSVELTGTHTYQNPINLNVPYSNSSNYDISDSWGGNSVISPSTLQGPCPDGFFLPTRDMISDLLGDFQTFGFSDASNWVNYPAILYYTKFIPQSRYFGLPFSLTYNSSVISRTNFRFSDNFNYNSNLVSILVVDGKIRYYNQYAGGNIGIPLSINGQYFMSARCFRNTALLPSNTWVALTGGDTSLFPPEVDEGGNQSTYSGDVSLNNCVDTQVCYNITGDNGEVFRICTTKCIDTGSIISGSYIGSDGTIYYIDSSYNIGNISNSDGVVYDTGFLSEDGLLSIDYYSGLFNGNGFKFGVCPYPPSDYLNFATKINLGNFFPFMPLNCFVSAFQQGVKVHYFDDSGLFPDNHSQLMAGDSHYHKTLFRFFDVLLSIGILLLLSALLRIIKK